MWRNTGHPVRVLMLDARACLPILCAAGLLELDPRSLHRSISSASGFFQQSPLLD